MYQKILDSLAKTIILKWEILLALQHTGILVQYYITCM